MPALRIRRATATDAEAAAAITRAAYARWVPVIGREPAPMSADQVALIGAGAVWIAETADGPAGVLVVVSRSDHLLVESVAVAPAAQGLGIGRALLAFAEDRACDAGLGEVRLYTHERMTRNIALYERLGYRITHRATEHGFARVHLAKRLQAKSASGAEE